jgi:SAM-dependent methyltransferase
MAIDQNPYVCRVCGSRTLGQTLLVKEMMFGTREQFAYDQCSFCGSLQIAAIPNDDENAAAYPLGYYSFSKSNSRGVLQRLRDQAVYSSIPSPERRTSTPVEILHKIGVEKRDSILDVGCGQGLLLDRLKRIGFYTLYGCDPFIDSDYTTPAGVSVLKKRLEALSLQFDVIMFNHSFEHVPSPADTLHAVRARLKENGICIIRIPTPTSDAFERYGAFWAQMDAPRHMTLISRLGMSILAKDAGFEVIKVIDDQLSWSLMASALYSRDIPMQGAPLRQHFSWREARAFDRMAAAANARGRGDQAAFVLRAAPITQPPAGSPN